MHLLRLMCEVMRPFIKNKEGIVNGYGCHPRNHPGNKKLQNRESCPAHRIKDRWHPSANRQKSKIEKETKPKSEAYPAGKQFAHEVG